MPTNTTIEAFYVGTGADLDPYEPDFITDNAASLVGSQFGAPPAPLYNSIGLLTLEDANDDGVIHSDDIGPVADTMSYGGVSAGLDSVTIYHTTVTFSDGSTASPLMIILQDDTGRVFLAPYVSGSGSSAMLDDHPIVSVHIDSVQNDYLYGVGTNLTQDAFITCFVQGSLIETSQGAVDVAKLAVGDLVHTMDHGMQPIRWIGGRRVWATDNLLPIQISAGALGCGLPTHDLWVSPQHRILLRSRIAERMFGTPEVLIAAKKLLGMPGINVAKQRSFVTYWHILFDRHEIVFSHGAASESLYLGPQAQKNIGADAVAEIQHLFPELTAQFECPKSARPLVKGKQQKQLLHRHIKNAQEVFQLM